jgi:acyl-coenzyme A synthetase/AMP-(fatty) acid ligase
LAQSLSQCQGSQPFATITQKLACFHDVQGAVSAAQFYGHVTALAEQLPERGYCINLCENRYLFTVAFCAIVLRGQANLLPPNSADATLAALRAKYDCYCLSELPVVQDDLLSVNPLELELTAQEVASLPPIAADQLAAVCFTSGSTGDSKPILKTWGLFARANEINNRHMLLGLKEHASMLATVPAQHMWGLETSVHLPLLGRLSMSDARPLFPADIVAQLNAMPEPRVLVTTPIHLRALIVSGLKLPRITRILCATSPLPVDLALKVEQATGAQVHEVYGCSEMGSMAIRRPVQSTVWQLFSGFELTAQADGTCLATAAHIPAPNALSDVIELHPGRQFSLLGRKDDMVDIAGKRGSLADLNKVLLQYSGIEDGVIFVPDAQATVQRLVAIVVPGNEYSKATLIGFFRARVDAAFVPRVVREVEKIPRLASGKITRKAMVDLYLET